MSFDPVILPLRAGAGLGTGMSLDERITAIEMEAVRQAKLTLGDPVKRTAYVELCYALTTIHQLQREVNSLTLAAGEAR